MSTTSIHKSYLEYAELRPGDLLVYTDFVMLMRLIVSVSVERYGIHTITWFELNGEHMHLIHRKYNVTDRYTCRVTIIRDIKD